MSFTKNGFTLDPENYEDFRQFMIKKAEEKTGHEIKALTEWNEDLWMSCLKEYASIEADKKLKSLLQEKIK